MEGLQPLGVGGTAMEDLRSFGAELESKLWPAWRLQGYVDLPTVAGCIAECATVTPGVVVYPEVLTRKFVDCLDAQLERVNNFVMYTEADMEARWMQLEVPRTSVGSEETRSTLSVIKSHLRQKCSSLPGQCKALNQLRSKCNNPFAKLAVLCEEAQHLRELQSLNYAAFQAAMKAFDAATGLSATPIFGRTLARAHFFNTTAIPRLVTEMQCVAKDLILRMDTDASVVNGDNLKQEFTCSVCLDVLRNPVVLSCAHSFCWHCAASSCVTSGSCEDWSCPLCRKVQSVSADVFTVNTQLQSFIDEHVMGPSAVSSCALQDSSSASITSWESLDFSTILQRKENAKDQSATQPRLVHPVATALMMPMGGPDDATQELPALPPLEDQGTDNMICSIPTQDTVNLEKAQATLAIQQNGHSPTVQIEGADVHSYRGQWVSMSDDLGFGSQAVTGKALSKPDQNAFKVGQGAADQVQSASVNHTDVTTKPKRKRGRPPVKPELSAEERRQIRLKKNRIAAQKSYRKRMAKNQLKKLEHEELEAAHKEAQAELSKARQRLSDICSFLERRGLLAEAEKEGLVVPNAPAKAPPQLHVSAGSQLQSYDIC